MSACVCVRVCACACVCVWGVKAQTHAQLPLRWCCVLFNHTADSLSQRLVCVVVCRAPEMEVKLPDELMPSLRQMKVRLTSQGEERACVS